MGHAGKGSCSVSCCRLPGFGVCGRPWICNCGLPGLVVVVLDVGGCWRICAVLLLVVPLWWWSLLYVVSDVVGGL